LVQTVAGKASFRTDHRAMISIRDYIDRHGSANGKRLLDDFSNDPFGWSPDTTRYILAAMLMAGEIKLTVSGREVTAAGTQAIEALKTNNSFRPVGVSLRHERPSNETLSRAAQRLTDLLGDVVIPLEQEISKATAKNFTRLQLEYGTLSERLSRLRLGGSERVKGMNQEIADILFTDASDAPQRLGAEESSIYTNLKWAHEVKRALDNGLETTLSELQDHCREISQLPNTGVPGDLRRDSEDALKVVMDWTSTDEFYRRAADFSTQLTETKASVRDAVATLADQQKQRLKDGLDDLQRVPEWSELTQEERSNVAARLDALEISVEHNLAGLKRLLTLDYDINSTVDDLRRFIQRQGQERILRRVEAKPKGMEDGGPKKRTEAIPLPAKLTTLADLEMLILRLNELRAQFSTYQDVELSLIIEGEK
jgi:hypothetical protein